MTLLSEASRVTQLRIIVWFGGHNTPKGRPVLLVYHWDWCLIFRGAAELCLRPLNEALEGGVKRPQVGFSRLLSAALNQYILISPRIISYDLSSPIISVRAHSNIHHF